MSYRCERCNSPKHTLDNCPHNKPSEYKECQKDLAALGVAFMQNGKLIDHAEVQLKYTEADLQEKLRQQREACANTYVEHHIEISPDLGYSIPCEKAILNAKIDNNEEEG